MRFTTDDSRRFPNDRSWGLGVWYFGWQESAIDANLGYRSFSFSWQRSRKPAGSLVARLRQYLSDPTIGFGIFRDSDGEWALSFGPWLWEFRRGEGPPQ